MARIKNIKVILRASRGSRGSRLPPDHRYWQDLVSSMNSSADSVNGPMCPRQVESARFLHMLSGVVVPDMDDIEIWSQLFFLISASVYVPLNYISRFILIDKT